MGAEKRTFDLTERYQSIMESLSIALIRGFSRLGPAESTCSIMDTRIGSEFLVDKALQEVQFDAHAHPPHIVPTVGVINCDQVVSCMVELGT